MVFVLIAIKSPPVGYCSGIEFLTNTEGSSNEFISEGESSDLFGQKNKPEPGNKAVGEGATMGKYAPFAFAIATTKAKGAAKAYVEYAAQEAREIGQEVAQPLRRQALDKIAGGMLFGAGAAILNNSSVLESLGIELLTLPGSGDPDISGFIYRP